MENLERPFLANECVVNNQRFREILGALELPHDGVSKMLTHIETFCQAHGGVSRYQQLLSMIHELKAANEGNVSS